MLGERSAQRGLFEADTMFADFVGRRNFNGFLASQRDEPFRGEDFAALYCCNNGRPSVRPNLLATALVLQAYDGVADDEAKQRADYDPRWKVALGIELQTRVSVRRAPPHAAVRCGSHRNPSNLRLASPPRRCATPRALATARLSASSQLLMRTGWRTRRKPRPMPAEIRQSGCHLRL